ncbi:MAG: ABC transporter ATP-binding protein [Cellulosilyticaceae bacterium]
MKVVEVHKLYKSFGEVQAINHLDLQIREGEIFGLLGPNGAGKSTTINILSMLIQKDKGIVKIFGKEIEQYEMEIKHQMGVVPQELAIFEELSAYENVSFFGSLYGLKREELKKKSLEALAFVGLEDKGKSKAKTFSGGMKRRLNIACGIVHSPKLIIMDEPTVGIDPQSRNYILSSIKELNRRGATVIYTTHYMEEAEAICDRIAIVDRGNVIAVGTQGELASIIDDKNTIQVMVRDITKVNADVLGKIKGVEHVQFEGNRVTISSKKEITNLDKIITYLTETEAKIVGIQTKELDLEDVFLNLTGRKLRD